MTPLTPTLSHREREISANAILRRRSSLWVWFFEYQFKRQLRRQFTTVRLSRGGGLPNLDGKPLVVYSNHASWWDAIVYFYLGRTLFRDRTGYGPIDAAELRRYPVLDRLGIFGIERDSFGGAAQFLSVARLLLATPKTMLWITAEGEFTDPRPRPLALQPGIAHLASAAPDIVFLPLAIEYSFWNEKRPELLLRFGAPVTGSIPLPHGRGREAYGAAISRTGEGVPPHESLCQPTPSPQPSPMREREIMSTATYTTSTLLHTLTESLAATMDALAAETITRDVDKFDVLLASRGGIHPFYDLLRRRA